MLLGKIKKIVKYVFYCYGNNRYCPICGRTSGRFGRYGGTNWRRNARCMHCGSAERHRLSWLYLQRHMDFPHAQKGKILHIAPEEPLEIAFRKLFKGESYVSLDLYSPRVTVQADIMKMPFPDGSFDAIYCSHVLEHVLDDRQAIQEIYRVLKPAGWAMLLVPITVTKTVEDPTLVDPQERLRLFGQEDHCRAYGPDYVDRLREAGFKVDVATPPELAEPEAIERMALVQAAGEIYCCRK